MKIYHSDKEREYFTDEGCYIIEIMNDSTSPEISVAQARVTPGTTTELHALIGTAEVYYILEGQGVMTVEEHTSPVSKGDCIRIEKDQSQSITNNGEIDLVFLCICQPRFLLDNYKKID